MTREEGKEFANALKNNYTIDFDKMPDFCDLVISALSAELCEDCISREATVKRLCKVAEFMNEKRDNLGAPYIMAALFIQDNKEVFPSVQPIRPKGEWLLIGHDDTCNFYRCSFCGYEEHDNFTKHHNFCPSCGADMRGE